jgi:hypothetical protein
MSGANAANAFFSFLYSLNIQGQIRGSKMRRAMKEMGER